MPNVEIFKPITTFFFDMDGVLTSGDLILLPAGLQARTMNVKDGYAIQFAIKMGYKVIIISGGKSDESITRFHKLGIREAYLEIADKHLFLKNYLQAQSITGSEALFMGDDVPDIAAMNLTALPCCPADAVEEVRLSSVYVSPYNGGKGCVRDVIEKVLKQNGHWHVNTEVSSI